MTSNKPSRRWWCAGIVMSVVGGCAAENPMSLVLAGNVLAIRQGVGPGIPGECYPVGLRDLRSHGTLDLMIANRYEFFGLIDNKLEQTSAISGESVQQLRTDASTVMLTGAEMTVRVDKSTGPLKGWNPASSVTTYYMPVAGMVESKRSTWSRFPLIHSVLGEQLRTRFRNDPNKYTALQRVTVDVQVEGEMLDGTVIRTQKLSYPVDLCWGCLATPDTAIPGVGQLSPEELLATCSQKNISSNFIQPCVVGNDDAIPCGFYCHTCDLEGTCDDRFCPQG